MSFLSSFFGTRFLLCPCCLGRRSNLLIPMLSELISVFQSLGPPSHLSRYWPCATSITTLTGRWNTFYTPSPCIEHYPDHLTTMSVLLPCVSRRLGNPVVSYNPLVLYLGSSLSGYCPLQYCRVVVSFNTLTPFVLNRRTRPIVPWWRGTFARSLG